MVRRLVRRRRSSSAPTSGSTPRPASPLASTNLPPPHSEQCRPEMPHASRRFGRRWRGTGSRARDRPTKLRPPAAKPGACILASNRPPVPNHPLVEPHPSHQGFLRPHCMFGSAPSPSRCSDAFQSPWDVRFNPGLTPDSTSLPQVLPCDDPSSTRPPRLRTNATKTDTRSTANIQIYLYTVYMRLVRPPISVPPWPFGISPFRPTTNSL
jgi:hypothetical protein